MEKTDSYLNKIKCPECNVYSNNNIFCHNCRYPLKVLKLSDYKNQDFVNFLNHLHCVLKVFNQIDFKDTFLDQIFHELFVMDWLRPESAIFNFMQLKSLHKYRSYFHYPTLDMGCGNGLISSIFFGGKLNFDFDNYGSIDLSNTDVYNSHTGSNINILSKKPSPIGYGIDIKVNSINNAKDLNVFDDLNVGDIRNLPFENNSVSTVFSNMIDDIKDDDLSQTFKEIYRVLRPDQYVIFTSPSEDYRNSLFYYPEIIRLIKADKADKAQQYKQYDRGRSHWLPRTTTFWKDFLEVHSFKLEVCESFLDDRLLKIWDVGLRPFFPKLLEIRNEFNNNNMLRELKSVIVEIFENYFFNIVNKPLNNKSSFLIIIAKKIG